MHRAFPYAFTKPSSLNLGAYQADPTVVKFATTNEFEKIIEPHLFHLFKMVHCKKVSFHASVSALQVLYEYMTRSVVNSSDSNQENSVAQFRMRYYRVCFHIYYRLYMVYCWILGFDLRVNHMLYCLT